MARIKHPTAEYVEYDVPDDSLPGWEEAGWKKLESPEAATPPAETPAVLTQGTEPTARTRKEA